MTNVGIQLFSLRDATANLPTVLRWVGSRGFDGVEFANRIHDADIAAVERALDETGLEPIAAHLSLERLQTDPWSVLEAYRTIGCSTVVIPHLSGSRFLSIDRIDALAAELADVAGWLDDHGFDLVVHTSKGMHQPVLGKYGFEHVVDDDRLRPPVWRYLAQVTGRFLPNAATGETGFERLVSATASTDVDYEVDVEHVEWLRYDSHAMFEVADDRLFAVHLSDGQRLPTVTSPFESCLLGDGYVDVERAIEGARRYDADWVIGEVDVRTDADVAMQSVVDALQV